MTYVGSIAIEAGDQVRFAKTARWNRDRIYTVDEVSDTEVVMRTPMSSGPMSEPYRLTHEEFTGLEPQLVKQVSLLNLDGEQS